MLCNGDLAFFCNCATTIEGLRLWAHERTLGMPRTSTDLETVEFADVFGAVAEDLQLTRCAQVCFTGTEEDQAERHDHGTMDEVLWQTKTWKKEEMSLSLVAQSPRKNVKHLGFVILAVLDLRSGDYIETCDIYSEKYSCRCYELPEHHEIISMQHDVRVLTSPSQDLKHTRCRRLDLIRSITRWELMCSRSLTRSVCAFRS